MLRRKSLCDGGGIQIVITEPQVDELKYNVATGVFDEVRMIFPGIPSISEIRKLEFLTPTKVLLFVPYIVECFISKLSEFT